MKKFAIVALAAASLMLVHGCKTDECSNDDRCVQNNAFGASFNDSQYVWEGFIFSTNRVEKVK